MSNCCQSDYAAAAFWGVVSNTGFRPIDLFPGMSVTDGNLVIPLSLLSNYGLTNALADPYSGDARQMLFAMVGKCKSWYSSLSSPPTALTVSFSLGVNGSYGAYPGAAKSTLAIVGYTDWPSETLLPEA